MANQDDDFSKILEFEFQDLITETSPPSSNNTDSSESTNDNNDDNPSIENFLRLPPLTTNEQSSQISADAYIANLIGYFQSDPAWQNASDGSQADESWIMDVLSPTLPTGSALVEPKAINTFFDTKTVIQTQRQLLEDAQQSKRSADARQQSATTASPEEYTLYLSNCQPITTVTTVNENVPHHQMLVEIKSEDTKKIRIRSQPRGQFRPRTENESRTSAHYIRCEDGVKPEYPTIDLPYEWSQQTDVNIIEVALVGLDKEPHPYILENKNSSPVYDPTTLIFRQDQRNVLFFRLTDEDFRNGYKTFLMQYIKCKQDEVITKELIRSRQLDQSMLRFTRIFGTGKDNFYRDDSTVQYSVVMQEAYGDIEIEHMGPRYGPMAGNEMVYAILKGRNLKNDLTIRIHEETTNWIHDVENFTKSGNVIYFLMPPFPYQDHLRTVVYISINYKGNPIDRLPYVYNKSLDQELAELRISDSSSTASTTELPKKFEPMEFFATTGAIPTFSPRKRGPKKNTKRLIQMS